MKKLFSLIIVPLVAIMCLCACNGDKTYEDVKKLYEDTTKINILEEENVFFSDASKPNSIIISYPAEVETVINNTTPTTSLEKKYVVIGYQQKILDNIFNYYENNKEEFFKNISSAKVDKNDMNNFYSALENLNNTLKEFKSDYQIFCELTKNPGVSEVMEFNLTNYSYELNRVIENSFNFIYKFIEMNEKYCLKDFDLINFNNLQYKIDRSYVDIAYIVYLSNFKAFDYSVGSKGISDIEAVVASTNKFSIIGDLTSPKKLSTTIVAGLDEENINHDSVMSLLNDYLYSSTVFNQRLKQYKTIYNSENIYTITQYKFNLVKGVDYDSYLGTLTKSKRATIEYLDEFVLSTYARLVDTLKLIVA